MSALHIVFRVGTAEYVVAASDVVQMESFTGVTKVPGTAAHVSGLVQIRSRVVPVVDLRARFRLPPVEHTLDTRIVVVHVDGRNVGLLVDSARDIIRIDPGDFKPPPDIVLEQSDGFVKSVAQAGERLLMLVDCEKIIGEEKTHVA